MKWGIGELFYVNECALIRFFKRKDALCLRDLK